MMTSGSGCRNIQSVSVITNSPSRDYTDPDDHTLPTYDVTNDIYIHYRLFVETTYTAALTYMSGTTLGFGLDDIRKTSDMEKISVGLQPGG